MSYWLRASLTIAFILAILALMAVLIARGQTLPAPYIPNELQSLRLQLRQRDAQLAQKDLFIAQRNLDSALKALNDEAAKVKEENNWPDGLVFDQQKLSFMKEQGSK